MNRTFLNVIRWVVFLPCGLVIASILKALPEFSVGLAAHSDFKMTWLNVVIAIVVASIALGFFGTWLVALFGTPKLVCDVIAPNVLVAAPIFGTVYGLVLLINVFDCLVSRSGWLALYDVFVGLVVIWGTCLAYYDGKERRARTAFDLVQ